MRVVFFGTPQFAVPSLSALLDAGIDVAAVVTQPDRPGARSHSTLVAPPVKQLALARAIPVWQPDPPRDETFYRQLREIGADLGVVVAYGHLLKPELLVIPRLGLVNVHASLLPRWRGAAPIQWALLSGDAETGTAIMRVEAGLDTGAVWHTRRTSIGEADTAGTLAERLSHLGAAALMEALPRVEAGEVPIPQSADGATHAPKINRETARIQWDAPADRVSRHIRAMDPAPGAWTSIGGSEMKVFGGRIGGRPASMSASVPGTIIPAENALIVATADHEVVEIQEVKPAGKRRMAATEWLRGAALPDRSRFE